MMTQVFGKTLFKLAQRNKNLFVVNADLASSLKLLDFKESLPHQFIETGVSEANQAGVAAGLAKSGKTVFITSFACFSPAINWNTIKQSICENNANVKIVGSHAGLASGDLGASHQMLEDIALTTVLPNLDVFAPIDELELKAILPKITASSRPTYLRLVRGSFPIYTNPHNYVHLAQGDKITILGYGPILGQALEILNENPHLYGNIDIINCSQLKPLNESIIFKSVKKTGRVIVLEDHQKIGGLGQIISALFLENQLTPRFIHIGVENSFGQSGKNIQELWSYYQIGKPNLLRAINTLLKS